MIYNMIYFKIEANFPTLVSVDGRCLAIQVEWNESWSEKLNQFGATIERDTTTPASELIDNIVVDDWIILLSFNSANWWAYFQSPVLGSEEGLNILVHRVYFGQLLLSARCLRQHNILSKYFFILSKYFLHFAIKQYLDSEKIRNDKNPRHPLGPQQKYPAYFSALNSWKCVDNVTPLWS